MDTKKSGLFDSTHTAVHLAEIDPQERALAGKLNCGDLKPYRGAVLVTATYPSRLKIRS
jgi:hypothetical protein